MKNCKHCNDLFTPTTRMKSYCGGECKALERKAQRNRYSKHRDRTKDYHRRDTIKRVLGKGNSNKGKKYTDSDKLTIMVCDSDGGFIYSSAELALELHRSQASIWQVRQRLVK